MTDQPQDRNYRFVAPKPEAEVDDELRFHVEERVRAYIAEGMTPDEARRATFQRFGNIDAVREVCARMLAEDRKAEARRDWFDDLRQDLRFAVRSAARAPLFSLLAVVTLSLGIGANAAIFGVVKSVLLDALPYAQSGELARIYCPFRDGTQTRGALSAGTVSDIRERQHSFASSGAFLHPRDAVYLDGETPQMVKAMFIEPQLLRTLGVTPIRGAGFHDDDGLHDTTTVVMISYAAWQRLFAADPSAIGKTIRLNGLPRTIVGVLPRNFVPPDEETSDFFQPLGMALFMRDPITVRGSHNFGFIGRLKPGVSVDAARREMIGIGAELERLYAKDNLGIGLTAMSLRDAMVGDTRKPLLALLGSAALVLLITCANLAGAMLSRTISRRKEFAVRVALGANRGRLLRQLLTESVLLSLVGGAAGLAIAMMALALLRGMALSAIPSYAVLSLDTGAILVTFALALATGLAFGAGPALSVGRADPQRTLRDETRGASESARSRRTRGVLVAGQVALCVSLLAGAGLLLRSLWAMTSAPIGFNPDGLLTMTLQPPAGKYRTIEARNRLYDDLLQRIRALPGVADAAVTSQLPTAVQNSNGLFIQDSPWRPNEPVPFILTVGASEDYFRAMGIPLKQGRVFTATDRTDQPYLVINEAMARRYWPKGNAVGARVHIGPPNPTAPWITVIGVVGSVRNDPTRLDPEPTMYLWFRAESYGNTLVIRTSGDPVALTGAVRRAIMSVDPMIPIFKVSTVNDVLGDSFVMHRLPVVLISSFGALALLLVSVGVYAMFANMAAAREREFGVRVALGSSRGAIARLVLGQGGVWMVAGLVLGAGGVVLAARLLRSQLFGVPEFDPIAISAALAILLVCAAVALLVPVRRATRVDPITVLR